MIKFYLGFIFLFITGISNSQPITIQWQKCFGGSEADYSIDIKKTNDGGYLLIGNSGSNDGDVSGLHSNSDDYWVLKIDSIGTILWQRCYGGSGIDEVSSFDLTANNGFVLAGYSSSNDGDVSGNHGDVDFWIVKCDSFGNIIWQKSYGGVNEELPFQILNQNDTGYVVVGMTNSSDQDVTGYHSNLMCTGCMDLWLLKLDTLGNIEWNKCYGGSEEDRGKAIIQLRDSNYLLLGGTRSNDFDVSGNHVTGSYDYWLLKIDKTGNLIEQKCFGGDDDEIPTRIIETLDKGYVCFGTAKSLNGDVIGFHGIGAEDNWALKLDSAYNIKWSKCFGGTVSDQPGNIIQLSDSSYILLGFTNSNDGDVSLNHGFAFDVWVLEIDQSGNLQWQQCLGGFNNEQGLGLQQTIDGGFIFSGTTASQDGDVISISHGSFDEWVVKFNKTSVGIMEPSQYLTDVSIHSSNGQIMIEFYAKESDQFNLELYDILGNIIFKRPIAVNEGFNQFILQSRSGTGLYYFRLISSKGFVSRKLLLRSN